MDYEEFFVLKDTPFRLTPDPDYYFPSDVHKEALQTLLYSIRAREGFIQITGDPGLGKTVTLRALLKQLGDEVTTALILNPRLSPEELLRVILEDLGVTLDETASRSKEDLLRQFREVLLEWAVKGVNTVLIIDEAQNLPNDTLEELRLLSNLETDKEKLLQIILVGQLELEEKLKTPELKQLDQRITIRYRLKPLSRLDTAAYIQHRMRVAGGKDSTRFPPGVLKGIFKASRGIPRLINILCERALMAAFIDGKNTIEREHLKKAVESIAGEKLPRRSRTPATTGIGTATPVLLSLLLIVALVGVAYQIMSGGLKPAGMRTEASFSTVKGTVNAPPAIEEPKAKPAEETKAEAESEGPPAEAFHVPIGSYYLSVSQNTQKAALWRGTASDGPAQVFSFDWKQPPPSGLSILGWDGAGRPFLFNYPLIFWYRSRLPGDVRWADISARLPVRVVPVISHAGENRIDPSLLDRAREVQDRIYKWAEAWQNRDLDRLMSYYAPVFTNYFPGMDKPIVYSQEQLRVLKRDIFARSGPLQVLISEPTLILSPNSPEILMAVFNQKYISKIYADEGIKALYFSLVEGEDRQREWKIVAKFWVPTQGNSPAVE